MLLSVSNVSKSFGPDEVLSDVTMRLDNREKVALVGRNGVGKTTLLRILTGEYEPDRGSVNWARGISIGYLSQHSRLNETHTVLEEAEEGRRHLVEMEVRLKELEKKLEDDPSPEDLDEYSLLHEHFSAGGGYSVERDLKTVLARMGFEESEYGKLVGKLSGGEKTRLTLAKLLLEEPDLLILDEPTNHLDLEATEWLEGWLKGYGGGVLLVSHDRMFLENVGQRVIEMRDGTVKSYPGPFQKFLDLRAEEDARLLEVARRQQDQMDKLDEFVRRFMNSQRTAQARGRLKHLERLRSEAIQAPKNDKGMTAGFAKAKRSGDIVLECKKLSMAFGEQKLFQDLDWTVRIGERWGVIGENGAGKSTLAKVFLGLLNPVSGTAKLGASVSPGFFSQDAAELPQNQSPVEILNDELRMTIDQARTLLGRFLLSGDDAMRPVKTLSGGERNKLALARLTAIEPNLLILDEPTNHLDMASRDALAEVLQEFTGTLILISHDRWLLEQVTSHTLDLRKEGARQYGGSYTEYRQWAARGAKVVTPEPAKPRVRFEVSVPPTLSPRELSKKISRLTRAVADAENLVAKLEADLESVERQMANPSPELDIYGLSKRHGDLQVELQRAMDQWVERGEEIEKLRAAQGATSLETV